MEMVATEPQVDPYYICHENYYDHLFSILKRLENLMDCYLVLNNNEFVLTHNFILSAFSGCVQTLPRHASSVSYVILKEVDAWSAKSFVDYLHTGELAIPKHNFACINRILQLLDINLGTAFFENDEIIHCSLNQSLKYDIINKIWLNRNQQCDVKILTEGMRETYAHAAILSACSDQLFTLFRAHNFNSKPMLIVLSEFSLEDVETVLKFCYKGEVEIPRSRASHICELARILGFKDLYNTLHNLVLQLKNTVNDTNDNKTTSKISCWEHRERTKKIFRTLFEKESLSDIQLICSDHTFKVHSAVLNLSPYFQALFELGDWRHSLVFLSKFSLEKVQAFVDYMYYGEVVFPGSVQDFTNAMQGLVDFSIMAVSSVESMQPEPTWQQPQQENTEICTQKPEENQCLQNSMSERLDFNPIHQNEVSELYTPPVPPVIPPEATTDMAKVVKDNKTLTYTCDTCSAVFYSRRSLKLHVSSHPESKNTQCSHCGQVFDRPSLRKIHERSHTGSRPYLCPMCGKSYMSQSALGKHQKTHTSSQVFECALCGRKCSRKEYLEEHIRTHTGSKPFKCTTCGKQFVGKTGLNHHRKVHEPVKKDSVCEVCGKAFTRKALWTHMKSHDKQYKCAICFKYFSTPSTLRSHNAMSHEEDKLFPCDVCGKKFALQNNLNRHKKTVHNPSRFYHCDKCPKVLSSELKLVAHEKSKHSTENGQSYFCNICSKNFSGRSALIYHKRSHTGVRPHSCTVCSKSFFRPDALQKHLRSHTRERPYRCNLCDQRCSSKSALNKHMKRHKNIKQSPLKKDNSPTLKYVCSLCFNNFNEVTAYTEHMKECHEKQQSDISVHQDVPVDLKELKPCIQANETSQVEPTGREPTVLQPLQSLVVQDSVSQQYIQVYVPGSGPEQSELPIIQMSVQSQQAEDTQFIQVFVPPDEHPHSY